MPSKVADLDFFSPDPLPPGPRHDVLTLGMVLHDWGLDKKMLLLRKVWCGAISPVPMQDFLCWCGANA